MSQIPNATRDELIAAMEQFDRDHRDQADSIDWEKKANQLYAIKWKGQLYPPKKIIALATHTAVGKFGGGLGASKANKYLQDRGLDIEKINERNPTWTRDELILALDCYLHHRTSLPASDSAIIQNLSEMLNRLGMALGIRTSETYRNANGVYMKLNNFRRLDPLFTAAGKVGLQRGGAGEAEIWREFSDDPARCARVAAAIVNTLKSDEKVERAGPEVDGEDFAASEGNLLTRVHINRERNKKIVSKKKAQILNQTGRLACECCGFEFSAFYGERGTGYIECHHITPVSDLLPGTGTRLDDLALVCANCHRMIHARRPWLTIAQLKSLLSIPQPVPASATHQGGVST